jgi:hypothetical protein
MFGAGVEDAGLGFGLHPLREEWLEPAGLPVDVIIDGTHRNQFGAYMYLEPGSYEVCGAQAIAYATPACQNVDVTGGAQTNVTLTYTPTP